MDFEFTQLTVIVVVVVVDNNGRAIILQIFSLNLSKTSLDAHLYCEIFHNIIVMILDQW